MKPTSEYVRGYNNGVNAFNDEMDKLKAQLNDNMVQQVRDSLATESAREAKGVDWARYQAVCDELESAQFAIEMLEAKVAEAVAKCAVMDAVLLDTCTADTKVKACEAATDAYDLTGKEALNKIKADAIREAVEACTFKRYGPSDFVIRVCDVSAYADKLEAGTL